MRLLRRGGTSTSKGFDAAVPLQVLGMVGLVVFAGYWGPRWAVLAGSLALLLVGVAASGLRIQLTSAQPPANQHMGPGPEVVPGQWT